MHKKHSQLTSLFAALLCLLLAGPVTVQAGELVEGLKNHPASIRGEDIDIAMLLRAIARQAGVTIFVAKNVSDTISLEMQDRTLLDIFNLAMEAGQLEYYEKNNLVFVKKDEDFQSKSQNVQLKRLCVKFGDAAAYRDQLAPMLTASGTITTSESGNCLVARDRVSNLDNIEAMLAELDKPVPQVYIEARIVSITQEAKRRLGVKWGFSKEGAINRGQLTGEVNNSISGASANLVVGFLRPNNLTLNLELQALEEDNQAKILAAPRILVLDGEQAEIKQGKEIAYVNQSGDNLNTSFREANLSLKVTPRVLKGQYILLDMAVTNDNVSSTATGGQPAIDTQEINSTLFLENRETVVIGGIIHEDSSGVKQRVPFLAGIPLLGNLFKNKDNSDSRSELHVFITPTIVPMGEAVSYNREGIVKADAQPDAGVVQPAPVQARVQEETITPPAEEVARPAPAAAAAPLESAAPAPQKTPAPAYSLQVGAFRQKKYATDLMEKLAAKGYSSYTRSVPGKDGKTWYLVRVGNYKDQQTATEAAAEFTKNEKKSAVVRLNEAL